MEKWGELRGTYAVKSGHPWVRVAVCNDSGENPWRSSSISEHAAAFSTETRYKNMYMEISERRGQRKTGGREKRERESRGKHISCGRLCHGVNGVLPLPIIPASFEPWPLYTERSLTLLFLLQGRRLLFVHRTSHQQEPSARLLPPASIHGFSTHLIWQHVLAGCITNWGFNREVSIRPINWDVVGLHWDPTPAYPQTELNIRRLGGVWEGGEGEVSWPTAWPSVHFLSGFRFLTFKYLEDKIKFINELLHLCMAKEKSHFAFGKIRWIFRFLLILLIIIEYLYINHIESCSVYFLNIMNILINQMF